MHCHVSQRDTDTVLTWAGGGWVCMSASVVAGDTRSRSAQKSLVIHAATTTCIKARCVCARSSVGDNIEGGDRSVCSCARECAYATAFCAFVASIEAMVPKQQLTIAVWRHTDEAIRCIMQAAAGSRRPLLSQTPKCCPGMHTDAAAAAHAEHTYNPQTHLRQQL